MLDESADAGVGGEKASRKYEVRRVGIQLIFWFRKSSGDRLLKPLRRLELLCFRGPSVGVRRLQGRPCIP